MSFIIHLFQSIECATPRGDADINYGLWVITVCQCRSIDCNKCTSLGGILIMGEAIYVGTGIYGTFLLPSPQFYCEPKT